VLSKTETGAAFMADARARIHRTLGVCCATSGGGMMNLAVGLAESHAEGVPVLAIIGQSPTSGEGRGAFQDSSGIGRLLDAVGLFKAITKYVARLDAPERFWEQLHAAVTAALTGRPGPVVLLVPRDLNEREVPPMPPWCPRTLEAIAAPPTLKAGALRALLEALQTAVSPLLVVGPGVSRSVDPEALVELARAARTPVVTTMSDPGAFPNDDPLWLGVVGAAGHPSARAYLDERADRIVAVGVALNTIAWQPPAIAPAESAAPRCPVGVVNTDQGELDRAVGADIMIEGDVGVVFRALLAMRANAPFTRAPLRGYELTRFRPILAEPLMISPDEPAPLRQSEALEALEAYLPRDGHVLFDAGNCSAASIHYLAIPAGTSSTIALGMGGMGYAIAGAVGAQLGSTATRTVVLCGDGAFLMTGLEIHTAVALQLPILYVVFNNRKHGMCVTRQQRFFDGRVEASEYTDVDVAAVARGLGSPETIWVGRAGTRAALDGCLTEYARVAGTRPGVLELRLDVEEIPPFAALMGADARETYVVDRSRRDDGTLASVA